MQVKTIVAGITLAVVGAGLLISKAISNKSVQTKRHQFETRLAQVNLPGKWDILQINDRWSIEYSTEAEVHSRSFADTNDPELDGWLAMLVLKHQTEVVEDVIDSAFLEYVEFKKTTEPALWCDVEVTVVGENVALLKKGEKSATVDITSFKQLDQAVRELNKE